MGVTPTYLIALTDKWAALLIACQGSIGTEFGMGDATQTVITSDWGVSRKARDAQALIYATGDPAWINRMQPANSQIMNFTGWQTLIQVMLRTAVYNLGVSCQASGLTGVSNLDTYLSYYNTGAGGPWGCLVAPGFATIALVAYGITLSVTNIYAPSIPTMATFVVSGSVFTAGTSVVTTIYAGEGQCEVIMTGITGSGIVTVTGTARTASGTIVTGRTWTATVTANGTFALTPTLTGDLLCSVSGVSVAAGITAGTLVVTGLIPSGPGTRTDPPT